MANSRKKTRSVGAAGKKQRWTVSNSSKKANPFEKSKAVEKRRGTLLVEYASRNKNNVFTDRRFGENNATLSSEEKMMQRFTLAKQKQHSRTSMYNLEEEDLTHMGQSLADGGFEDRRGFHSSDEEEEVDRKAATRNVKETHFGGFLTKKQQEPEAERRSHKDIMDEVVAKSKKRKAERQLQRDAVLDLTEKLDQKWKEMGSKFLGKQKDDRERPKADSFDKTVRELSFEARQAHAKDRIRTEEEHAEEQYQHLQQLEEERVHRMQPPDSPKSSENQSADSLTSGPTVAKGSRFTVHYRDGKLVMPDKKDDFEWQSGFQKKPEDDDSDDSEDDSGDEEGEDDEEEELSGSEGVEGSGSDGGIQGSDGDEEVSSGEDEDEEEAEDASEDEDEEGSEEEEEGDWSGADDLDLDNDGFPSSRASSKKANGGSGARDDEPSITGGEVTGDSEGISSQDLPFTFAAPTSLEDLEQLLRERSSVQQTLVLERVRACHHPKLAAGNRAKMAALFEFVVEYLDHTVADNPAENSTLIGAFSRPLFDLAQDNPQPTSQFMHDRLVEAHQMVAEARTDPSLPYVSNKMHTTLQVAGTLYSTSDYQHRIVTPALLLMADCLAQCPLRIGSLHSCLWLCQMILQYVRQSKRFIPEMVNFLCGVLAVFAASPSESLDMLTPPFVNCTAKDRSSVTSDTRADVLLSACIQLLLDVVQLYAPLPSFTELFEPVSTFLQRLSSKRVPGPAQDAYKLLVKQLKDAPTRQAVLQLLKKKPVPLKLYEPKFDESYQVGKRTSRNPVQHEESKLKHKLKKEKKGAVRELRKDTAFLQREVLKEQLAKDEVRKKKVNTLLHELRQT